MSKMKELGVIPLGDATIKIISNSEALTVAEIYFPAGSVAAVHHHVNEEVNYVVKGAFEFMSNGERMLFKVGDVLQVPSNIDHNIRCLDGEDGVVLSIWTPSRKDLIAKI